MNKTFLESREAIQQARDALRHGDRSEARRWAEQAAKLTPQAEEPYLILAAVASPQASIDYIKKAMQVNPESPQAKKALDWAMRRLGGETPAQRESVGDPAQGGASLLRSTKAEEAIPQKENRKRSPIFAILLVTLGCAVVALAAWSASSSPALAAILSLGGATQPPPSVDHPQSWVKAEIAKPTYTLTPSAIPATLTATSIPTSTLTPIPTDTPTPLPSPTLEATLTLEPTTTPGILEAVIVPDTPTSEYVAPTVAAVAASSENAAAAPAAVASGEHWIDVDLSQQRVYAYAGDTLVNSFVVSTGTWQTPTVVGTFKVWIKLRSTTMAGPGYYLPDVPYTMYFYKGYGLHGTYWHNNFGTPMSHGCVNLSIPDAEWLYNFSVVGTTVNVHY